MKRAVAYARYSSDVQSDTSIEAQLEKIKEYCAQKGYQLVKEYIDRAVSAATDKRPAFQQMIKDAEQRMFDVVVVYKLDRFARNLYDSVVYTKKLEEAGVALESVTEPITHDIAGKFFRNVMSAINELYIENLKQELRDKALIVARKGYFMGGIPP
ncbi:MAG: recombinase family protein, partial [Deltaproteobacteria bacterium]